MECGALDGEYLSNSLLFEIQLGWWVDLPHLISRYMSKTTLYQYGHPYLLVGTQSSLAVRLKKLFENNLNNHF